MATQYTQQTGNNAWNIWQLNKLRLRGVPWKSDDHSLAPSLMFTVTNGNPRFRLYLNEVPGGGDNNSHPVTLDPYIFGQLIEALRDISTRKEADKVTVNCMVSWERGVKLDEPSLAASVTVGRNTDGIMYLTVAVKGQKQCVFHFQQSYWGRLIGANGEELDKARASNYVARSWGNLLAAMLPVFMVARVVDPAIGKTKVQGPSSYAPRPPQQAPAPAAGGWGNAGSFENDIPF